MVGCVPTVRKLLLKSIFLDFSVILGQRKRRTVATMRRRESGWERSGPDLSSILKYDFYLKGVTVELYCGLIDSSMVYESIHDSK